MHRRAAMTATTPERNPRPRAPLARRILKWGAITIATLVVLLVVAIAVIPHLVNLGPVKREIESVASRSSGRAVTIEGPLSLSLFPWVGFEAHDVSMANAAGFGTTPFLRASELDIHAKLIPLIFGHVEISGIALDHLALHLVRKSDGRSNWQDLVGHAGGSASAHRPGAGARLAGLSIGRIDIAGASLAYDDVRSGRDYSLTGLDLRAGGIAPGQEFPLHIQTAFNSRQPHFDGRFGLDARARFDAAGTALALDNGHVTTTLAGAGLAQPVALDARWQSLSVNSAMGTARLAGLVADAAGVHVQLDGAATDLAASPRITGRLQVAPFSPRALLAKLAAPIPSRLGGFERASLASRYAATTKALSLSDLTLHLDDTTLSGRISVPLASSAPLQFDLAADRLDLNRYLPAGSGPATHAATAHSERFLDTRLPGRLLRNLNLDGSVSVNRLDGLGLSASKVQIALKAARGTVTLAPLQAQLYGGSYSGKATVAAAGDGIRLDTVQRLAGVDAGKIIAALGGGSRLSGTADAAVTLAGRGDTIAELLDTLNGRATFALHHGAVEGFNLWDQLERAYVLVKEHKRLPTSGPARTEFADFAGSAKIAHGVLSNDALEATLPFLTLSGHGSVDLNKHYVNYDLLAKVVNTPKTTGVALANLKGVTVPVHVSGGFGDLSSAPDIKAALETRAKAALEKKLEQQKKDAQKLIRSKLQELLENSGGGGG